MRHCGPRTSIPAKNPQIFRAAGGVSNLGLNYSSGTMNISIRYLG